MKPAKSLVKPIESHVSKTKKPMGDYYGTGVKQKTGRIIDSSLEKVASKKSLSKPPKSLA